MGGVCMFQYECLQLNGEPIGYCFNSYLVGTCCKLPNNLRISSSSTANKSQESISSTSQSEFDKVSTSLSETSTEASMTIVEEKKNLTTTSVSNNFTTFSTTSSTTQSISLNESKTPMITSHFVPNNNGQMDVEDELGHQTSFQSTSLSQPDFQDNNDNELIEVIEDNHSKKSNSTFIISNSSQITKLTSSSTIQNTVSKINLPTTTVSSVVGTTLKPFLTTVKTNVTHPAVIDSINIKNDSNLNQNSLETIAPSLIEQAISVAMENDQTNRSSSLSTTKPSIFNNFTGTRHPIDVWISLENTVC